MFKTLFALVALFVAEAVSAQTITISSYAVYNTLSPMPGAAAYYVLTSQGDIITAQPNSTYGQDVGDWLTPTTNISSFQLKAGSHTCSGGPNNTTVLMTSSPAWHLTPTGGAP